MPRDVDKAALHATLDWMLRALSKPPGNEAPAAGTAEVIVDITTTGATLKGNGLKILGDGLILDSYANLAASLTADWTDEAKAACKVLLNRLDSTGGLQGKLSADLA